MKAHTTTDHTRAIELVQELLSMGASLAGLQGVDRDDLEQVYAYGYALFEGGDLEAARRTFYTLAYLDNSRFEYWLALGLTLQRMGEHKEALACFARSGAIGLSDPRSAYLAGVSFVILGNPTHASKAFDAAIKWCGKRPEHQALRMKAEQSLVQCNK
ncbi:SycD/LcrH family type III secretion system chaperone [Burkholderia sp. WSM2232]|uniref:SycD/LcrH family type III secretion system chaperone n=1 Tax=Burkholderia sp. WSM2232 TaxID=944436 RepID=UPI0006890A7A|nr:SycD/LcrH family type III secretion system chaperone [Burkholderia sp. WSM2232]